MKYFFIFLFISTSIFAQKKANTSVPKEIKLIYSDKEKKFKLSASSAGSLKIKDNYFYSLTGFNPYVLDVKVLSVKPINFKAGFSSKLNEYLGPVDFGVEWEFIPSTPRAFPSSEQIRQKREAEKEKLNELIVSFTETTTPQFFASSTNRFMSLRQQDALIESKVVEFKENYPILNKEVANLENLMRSYELLKPQIEEFNTTYIFTSTFYADYLSLLESVSKTSTSSAKNLVADFIKKYNELTNTKNANELIKELSVKITSLNAIYQSINQTVNNGLEVDAELQKSITDVHKLYNQINFKIPEGISSLSSLQNIKDEIKTKEQYHKPIADASRIKILVLNKSNPKDTVLLQTLEIPTCNGWDVDFSGGIIYNSIWRQAYALRVDNDPTNFSKKIKTIIKEPSTKFDVAFAALLNFSYRRCHSRFGPSTGVALSFLDGNLKYLVGLHYHFGYKTAFGLSAGAIFGKRVYLSEAVSDDGKNANNPINDAYGAVPTYEKYKTGFYAGLVWNFARK